MAASVSLFPLVIKLDYIIFPLDHSVPHTKTCGYCARERRDSLSPSARATSVPHIHEPTHVANSRPKFEGDNS